MPLNAAEFGELSGRLVELEDFLKQQRRCTLAVRHSADAAVLQAALSRVISVHALVQLMAESDPRPWLS